MLQACTLIVNFIVQIRSVCVSFLFYRFKFWACIKTWPVLNKLNRGNLLSKQKLSIFFFYHKFCHVYCASVWDHGMTSSLLECMHTCQKSRCRQQLMWERKGEPETDPHPPLFLHVCSSQETWQHFTGREVIRNKFADSQFIENQFLCTERNAFTQSGP